MTLEDARATAMRAVATSKTAWIVYRFPGWPAHVWGCKAEDGGLPPNAEIDWRYEPEREASDQQGSLFGAEAT